MEFSKARRGTLRGLPSPHRPVAGPTGPLSRRLGRAEETLAAVAVRRARPLGPSPTTPHVPLSRIVAIEVEAIANAMSFAALEGPAASRPVDQSMANKAPLIAMVFTDGLDVA